MQASLEEVVSAGAAIQYVLAGRQPGTGAYVIGSPAVFRHVADAGHRILNGTSRAADADVVVVAGHDDLKFVDLRDAIQAVLGGAEMIVSCRDRTFPTQDGLLPGTGAIVAALEYATERTATAVGKPEPQIFLTALDRLGDGRTLVVGRPARCRSRGCGDGRAGRRDRPDRRHRPRPGAGRRRSRSGQDRRRPPLPARRNVRICLVVNPSAGGGRAGRTLPDVIAELTRRGIEHRVEATRSLEHAKELALAAAAAGETTVTLGGDGLIGAVADALKHSDGVLGLLPGGRGNDFARVLKIPLDPVAACAVIAGNVVRELDLGEVNSRTFISIASCGFDSDANRIANETRLVRGNLVYAYGALRALAGWRPAQFEISVDGRDAAHDARVHRRGRQLRRLRRRHAARPQRLARGRRARRGHRRARPQAPVPAHCCRRCSRASTCTSAPCR